MLIHTLCAPLPRLPRAAGPPCAARRIGPRSGSGRMHAPPPNDMHARCAAAVALLGMWGVACTQSARASTVPHVGPNDQLARYGFVGSMVSDDVVAPLPSADGTSEEGAPDTPNPRTQWPGNKIVVLVRGHTHAERRHIVPDAPRRVWAGQG